MNWNREIQSQSASCYFSDFRFYDPKCGRFVQTDTMIPRATSRAMNRLAYAYNNPIKYLDPDGHVPRISQDPDDETPVKKVARDLVDMGADLLDYVFLDSLSQLRQASSVLSDPDATLKEKVEASFILTLSAVSPGSGKPKKPRGGSQKGRKGNFHANEGSFKPGEHRSPDTEFKPGTRHNVKGEFKKGRPNMTRIKGPRKKLLIHARHLNEEDVSGLMRFVRAGSIPQRSLVRIHFFPKGGYVAIARTFARHAQGTVRYYDTTYVFNKKGKNVRALEHWDPNVDPLTGEYFTKNPRFWEPVEPHHTRPSRFDSGDWDIQAFVGRRADGRSDLFPIGPTKKGSKNPFRDDKSD